MAAKRIQIDLQVNAKKGTNEFEKFSKTANKNIKSIEKQSKTSSMNMIKSFKAVGAAIVGAMVFREFISGIKESINLASEMEGAVGKFSVVFRGVEEDAKRMRDTLVDAYAMSSLEATRTLSSFQDLLVPLGLSRQAAAEASFEWSKFAADLASFNTVPTERAITAINAALRGQYEPLSSLGIALSQNEVNQRALNNTMKEGVDELTRAEKAAAAFQLALERGSDSIGDMARTSGEFDNQMKKLNANLEDAKILIGEQLLPYVNEYVTALNDWFKANKDILAQDIPKWIEKASKAVKDTLKFVEQNKNLLIYGVIGVMLFGLGGPAGILAAIGLTADRINKMQKKAAELAGARGAVSEMAQPESSNVNMKALFLDKALLEERLASRKKYLKHLSVLLEEEKRLRKESTEFFGEEDRTLVEHFKVLFGGKGVKTDKHSEMIAELKKGIALTIIEIENLLKGLYDVENFKSKPLSLMSDSINELRGFPLDKMDDGSEKRAEEKMAAELEAYMFMLDLKKDAEGKELASLDREYAAFQKMYGDSIYVYQKYIAQRTEIKNKYNELELEAAAQQQEKLEAMEQQALLDSVTRMQEWAASAIGAQEILENAYKDMVQGASEGLTTLLENFAMGISQSTKDIKEWAATFLHNIGRMIIQQTILNALQSQSGGVGGFLGSIFGAAGGGTGASTSVPYIPAAAEGGVLSGPKSGYPAMLHGTEAVIPLNKMGAMGGVSTTINVAVNGSGGGGGSDEDRKRLGKDIAIVVKQAFNENLRQEMRPGGMLNRSA